MDFREKIINPPCNSLKATSLIMPDEKEGKRRLLWEARVVMWTVPEQPRTLECPYRSVPPDLPILHEAIVGEEARRRVADEGTEPLSVVGRCELESVTFEEAAGRAGLISETETPLDTAALLIG